MADSNRCQGQCHVSENQELQLVGVVSEIASFSKFAAV